jgi:CTP:molybdopterin cytidylyltransferase MocA
VIFRAELYGELLAASAEVGARQVVWNHAAEVTEVETDEEGVILNLNDPETVRKAIGD